jgi:hypothetical protein
MGDYKPTNIMFKYCNHGFDDKPTNITRGASGMIPYAVIKWMVY